MSAFSDAKQRKLQSTLRYQSDVLVDMFARINDRLNAVRDATRPLAALLDEIEKVGKTLDADIPLDDAEFTDLRIDVDNALLKLSTSAGVSVSRPMGSPMQLASQHTHNVGYIDPKAHSHI